MDDQRFRAMLKIENDPRLRAQAMKPDYTQDFIDQLIHDGVIVKTGEMRPDRKGVLQPTYTFAPKYKDNQALANVLLERYGLRH
jgi:hypothetical protein